MGIWQSLEKNATQIMIFLPHLCGRKIIKKHWITEDSEAKS